MIKLLHVLEEEMNKGKEGYGITIPISLPKLNNYIEIAKNSYYVIAGITGSGKSTLVHQIFLIDVLQWWQNNKDKVNLKLNIIYFGMERKMYMYAAKWVSRTIFINEGIYIPYKKILKFTLSRQELELVNKYKLILDQWQENETLICFEGIKSVSDIKKFINNFASKHGTLVKIQNDILETKIYKSNHKNHIVLIIYDHLGLTKKEQGENSIKITMDNLSRTMQDIRDKFGFSPVIVQQLNRGVQQSDRLKLNDVLPKLTDLADTSITSQDADVILALLDPYSILQEGTNNDVLGYNIQKLKDERFSKFYRSLHILKNSFDSNGIHMGLALHPYTGIFKDMPEKNKDMTDELYESIRNSTYFINKK